MCTLCVPCVYPVNALCVSCVGAPQMLLAIDEVNDEEVEESVPDDKVTVTEVD